MDYELFISRASPYSSKIVALLGYAGVDHEIRIQNGVNRFTVIRRLTGKTMVPVLRRGDWALNDSTKIAEYIMEQSERPLLPNPEAQVLAWFIEDFADEWMVRWMADSRWRNEEDADHVAQVVGRELMGAVPVGGGVVGRQAARLIQAQMKPWGVRRESERALRGSAQRCLAALEAIFSRGPDYLFGAHPTVADFSIYGPLVQYGQDPTGRRHMEDYPALREFIRRMDALADRPAGGEWAENRGADLSRLTPLFGEIMGTYWPVMAANHRARIEENKEVVADLIDGSRFRCCASGYLQARLEWLLEHVDRAYAKRDRLFGEQGMRMERALVGQIAELSESEAGRHLLRRYDHVGLH